MEWIETTGTTLDEAKERALDRLGVAEDELEYEVLEEATSRMLGLKRTDARMRARVRPTSPRSKTERRDRTGGATGREAGVTGQGREKAGQNRKRTPRTVAAAARVTRAVGPAMTVAQVDQDDIAAKDLTAVQQKRTQQVD